MDKRAFLQRKIFLKRQAVLLLREEIRNLQTQTAELDSKEGMGQKKKPKEQSIQPEGEGRSEPMTPDVSESVKEGVEAMVISGISFGIGGGLGDTKEEAQFEALEAAEKLKAKGKDYDKAVFEEADEVLEEAEKYGISFKDSSPTRKRVVHADAEEATV